MQRGILMSILVVGSAAIAGCRSMSAELQPAKSATAVPEIDAAAMASARDVTVVAAAIEWPGSADITERVTPLRVTVTNKSDQKVRVRLEDFQLVSASGRAYRALPPMSISGSVDVVRPPADYVTPGFEYSGFSISEPYAYAYPSVVVYEEPYDYTYYNANYPLWDVEQFLPTPEMTSAALPEGVVDPNGYVAGWLYFQKVDEADETPVEFRADLQSTDEGAVAELRIPFEAG